MTTAQTGKKSRLGGSKPKTVRRSDAITLLKAQHREVEAMFAQYETAASDRGKQDLVRKLALALKAHTQVEEEIFYPEARRAINDEDLLDEAVVEHQAAKQLLAEIETMRPGDDLYDAKVKVLSEEIEHHVQEEETELFPQCRRSEMDLAALELRMRARFEELVAELAAQTPRLH